MNKLTAVSINKVSIYICTLKGDRTRSVATGVSFNIKVHL